MSLEALLSTTTITIIEPGSTVDEYDDEVLDWDNPTSETATTGWLTQVNTIEEIGGRDVIVTSDRLFLRAGTSISPSARVVANGKTYEVDGEPATFKRGWHGDHHMEMTLRYVEEVESEVVS